MELSDNLKKLLGLPTETATKRLARVLEQAQKEGKTMNEEEIKKILEDR